MIYLDMDQIVKVTLVQDFHFPGGCEAAGNIKSSLWLREVMVSGVDLE